jgi:hypothetical protein
MAYAVGDAGTKVAGSAAPAGVPSAAMTAAAATHFIISLSDITAFPATDFPPSRALPALDLNRGGFTQSGGPGRVWGH